MLTATSIRPISLRSQFIMFNNCWHLVKYIPGSVDAISQSIIYYKHNEPTITERWNNLAVKLIAQLNFHPDCIVRALASREKQCTGTRPLDLLCHNLAKNYGLLYNQLLLTKKDFTRPLHNMPKKKRIETLNNKYVFNNTVIETEPKKILIIDDIVTTGTTMLAIRDAIRQVTLSAEVYFFAFARTAGKW
jgi:predicted amidophosphoribosyltransferase